MLTSPYIVTADSRMPADSLDWTLLAFQQLFSGCSAFGNGPEEIPL